MCCLLMGTAVGTAFAHGLQVTTGVEGERIVGEVRESGGAPVADIPVSLFDDQPNPKNPARVLHETRSDARGRFFFPLDPALERIRIVAADGLGHRAELSMGVIRTTAAPQSAVVGAPRERFWRDLLAGLGYIVGLAGLAAWWLARRGRR